MQRFDRRKQCLWVDPSKNFESFHAVLLLVITLALGRSRATITITVCFALAERNFFPYCSRYVSCNRAVLTVFCVSPLRPSYIQ